MNLVNPFDRKGQWYKANLHTHTTNSDGEVDLAQRVQQYRQANYDILAITDHLTTNDVEGLSDDKFLVINGYEAHPYCPGKEDGLPYHLVFLNIPHGFILPRDCDANTCVKMAKDAGGQVIYGHPYWCGQNINHILAVDGFIAVEIFNSCCTKIGKGYSSVQWDDLLLSGRIVGGVAVDDVHQGRDIFMGWTYIKAAELTIEAVMQALVSGSYYASCGPTIEDFRIEDGVAKVKCSPVREIHFIGAGSCGKSLYADDEPLMTEATFEPAENSKYLRVEIIDEKGKHAWTNPLIIKGNRWI